MLALRSAEYQAIKVVHKFFYKLRLLQ